MTTGLQRRDATQDSLAGRADMTPVTLNGPQVSSPRPVQQPDTSAQARVADQLAQWSGGKLQQAVEKQQHKDILDGQMAYQQGAAFDQLQTEGNKFAMEGYRLMDAQTISSSMLAAQQEEIAQSAHTLDPDSYRTRYVNRLDAMLEGKDPRTAELVRTQMAEHMPSLVADHTVANMQYLEGENYASLERSIDIISRDPTATETLVDFAQGGSSGGSAGLSDARRQSAVVSGVLRAFENDNPLAYSALASHGLLGDNLTTQQMAQVRGAQQAFENRRRAEYDEALFEGEQDLMRQVETGGLDPSDAVEKLSILYADHDITMNASEAGAIYSQSLGTARTRNLEGSVLLEEARLRGDYGTMATITQDVIRQVESGGDMRAVGPVIEGGANRGDQAEGSMKVMPLTQKDPGFGVTPARDNSPAELQRVGRDYWAAMVSRYDGDLEAAAVAYNAGPGNADDWIQNGRDYSTLPDQEQTEDYVRKFQTGLGNWQAPTAADRLSIAQGRLAQTRERLAMDIYEEIAPRLADTDDMFKSGELDEGAWRERREHLYARYGQARTEADVNHEISTIRQVDAAAVTAATSTYNAAYKLALDEAELAITGARSEWETVLSDPASGPDEIRAANKKYTDFRTEVFDGYGIQTIDRSRPEEQEAILTKTGDALTAHRQYTEDGVQIDHAVAMGYLGDLPRNLQDRAFKQEEQAIVQSVQEALGSNAITEDQAEGMIAEGMNAFIASAGVTNPRIATQMSAAMRGPLIDKEGNPNPMIVDTIEQYAQIKAMNPHAANTFMDEKSRIMAEAVLARSGGIGQIGEGVRTLGLETTANPLREDTDTYLARPDVQRNVDRVVNEFIDSRDIGVLQAIFQKDATLDQRRDNTGMSRDGLNSPEMREAVTEALVTEVSRLQNIHPQIQPADLVAMAGENVSGRTEIIGGNPVMLSAGNDIRQNFFGSKAGDFMHDGAINSAVMDWLRSDEARAQYPEMNQYTVTETLPQWMQSVGGLFSESLDPKMDQSDVYDSALAGVRPFVSYGVGGDVVVQYLRPNGSYSDPIVVPARRAGEQYMRRRMNEAIE